MGEPVCGIQAGSLTVGSRWLSASDTTGKNSSLVPTPAGVAAPTCSHPPAAAATPPGSGEPGLGSGGVTGAQPPATRWDPSGISDPGDRQVLGRPASPADGRGAFPPSRAAPPKTAASCLRESGGKPSALHSGQAGGLFASGSAVAGTPPHMEGPCANLL